MVFFLLHMKNPKHNSLLTTKESLKNHANLGSQNFKATIHCKGYRKC